jgi:aldehyde:ferredoxin oxidoreductase
VTYQGGYAGNILRVDLSSGDITKVPTETYAEQFLGGRGIAAKIYWDEVPPSVDAFHPENRLIFVTGPVSGISGFASRFQVCGKSPINNQFSYCNLGGSWGAWLKFAGYDAVVVYGKADKPAYLWVDDGKVEIRDATHLKGKGAYYTEGKIKEELGKSVHVLTVGPAGDNMVSFATFLASDNSCGSGGLAGVMGSKNLKAIAVRGDNKLKVASHERILELRKKIHETTLGLPEAMRSIIGMVVPTDRLKSCFCHGCPTGCLRAAYYKPTGEKRKFMCQAALFYQTRAQRYYGKATDVPFKATELCDDYGLDTRATETMIMWLSRCYRAGILTEEQTEIPLSQIGSYEFIETLARKISYREGLGHLLAGGTHKAAETLGSEAQKLIKDYITSTGTNEIYGPRLYITTGIFYAMEPRLPIQQLHEVSEPVMLWVARIMGEKEIFITSEVLRAMAKRFFGNEIAADFSTYEGKALAAARIQDREYAKESLILCDLSWPIFFSQASEDHVGDPSLESQICAAVTGREVDEAGLYKIGQRIFNLQRAILVREGHKGREYDSIDEFNFTTPLREDFGNPNCLVPGKNGEVFSRKGMVVDRGEFEKMKDEFYQIRAWDLSTGLQKRARLEELGLSDVAQILEREGLLRK